MNDFHYSATLALIPLSISIIVLLLGYKGRLKPNNYFFVWLGLVLFSVFGFAEYDTYHYMDNYEELYKGIDVLNIEPAYHWLVHVLPHSFYLWRFAIWGSSACMLVYVLKKLNADANMCCILSSLFFMSRFVVTRGAVGFSLLILSMYILFTSKKKILYIALALGGLYLSYFLHKSMPVFILLLPVAYLIPLNKKALMAMLIMFPVIYSTIYFYMGEYMSILTFSEMTENAISSYYEHDLEKQNIYGYITDLINFAPFIFLLLVQIFYKIKNENDSSPDNKFKAFLLKYSLSLVFLALLFYGQGFSEWMSKRFFHAASFPLFITSAYYAKEMRIAPRRSATSTVHFNFVYNVSLLLMLAYNILEYYVKFSSWQW